MSNIPEHAKRAMEKHGGMLPTVMRDKETGKIAYDNRDATAMAKRYVLKGGSAADFQWGKIDYALIPFRCTKCGDLRDRFFHQKDGFFCHECGNKSEGLEFPRENEELIAQILECNTKNSSSIEQGKLISDVLSTYLNIHNEKYTKKA